MPPAFPLRDHLGRHRDQEVEGLVGRFRGITHDAGHPKHLDRAPYYKGDLAAYRVGRAEVALCLGLGQHHRIRRSQRRGLIALDQGEFEDVEEVGINNIHLLRRDLAALAHGAATRPYAGPDKLGIVGAKLFQRASHGGRAVGQGIVVGLPQRAHHVDLVCTWDPLVETRLELHIERQHQEDGDAHRQAQHVQRGVEAVAGERTVEGDQVVAEHGSDPPMDGDAHAAWPHSPPLRSRGGE